LPTDLVEETRSAINRVVGLQLHPSQWSVVDDRLHQIAEATRADGAATLRSALNDLTDLSADADAPSRPSPQVAMAPRTARRGAAQVAWWFIVAVALVLLGIFTVGIFAVHSSLSPSHAIPSDSLLPAASAGR
jgi:hypothetical protein